MNEWTEYNKTWEDFELNDKLNKPGTVISHKIKTTGKVQLLIVGHINTMGGVCNCCNELKDDDIIIKYKVLDYEPTP